MRIDIKFESLNDFNNNLAFISKCYEELDQETQNYIYNYICVYVEKVLKNIKLNSKNFSELINKFYAIYKLNINEYAQFIGSNLIANLCELIAENFYLCNKFEYSEAPNEYTKLNKIFVLRELVYIIKE